MTSRARRRGFSNPTVHTRKGRASVRQTGSSGIPKKRQRGRVKRNAKHDERKIPVESQKLEPRARDEKKRRRKVECMRM